MGSFLDFHAKKGTGYLHPGGVAYTDALIEQLNPVKGLRLLEVGCGTGATIVHITKNHHTQSTAVDFSRKMLRIAKQRARFNGVLKQISFVTISDNGLLPFEDNAFDAVYAESVLGIVSETVLPQLVKEIARVLVQEGTFISNDAVWKESTSRADIERINGACLRDFGLVQSVARPAYKSEWLNLFKSSGLNPKVILDNASIKKLPEHKLKRDLFWYYKTCCAFLNPLMQYKRLKYNRMLQSTHVNDKQFLENYVFVTENNKQVNQEENALQQRLQPGSNPPSLPISFLS